MKSYLFNRLGGDALSSVKPLLTAASSLWFTWLELADSGFGKPAEEMVDRVPSQGGYTHSGRSELFCTEAIDASPKAIDAKS